MNAIELRQHYSAVKERLHARAWRRPVVPNREPDQPIVRRDVLIIHSTAITKAIQETNALPEFMVKRAVHKALSEIAIRHGVFKEEIFQNRRLKAIVHARQEGMWWCKKNTTWSLPQIGRFFGGYDHTTVLHAYRKHERRLADGAAK